MGDAETNAGLDRESPLPLWAQLYADLTRRLAGDEFADDFPPEMDLASEYGVSRNTVREAMRRLREEGVVVAERGRRPRLVLEPEIQQPLGALYSLFASVEAGGLEQQSVVRALEIRADADVARRLGRAPTTPLFYLERLRLADGEPLALDRVWMASDVASDLLNADFTHTALYDELFRRTGLRLTTGREQIRAVVPTGEDRELLQLEVGEAALAIDRLATLQGELVKCRHTIIRGDRFSLVAEFSPRSGFQFEVSIMNMSGIGA